MPQNYGPIKASVEKAGDVKTFTMLELRNAHGTKKLGSIVAKEISKALARMGLGHVPIDIPGNQENLVRVYKQGTQVADIIQAALSPGKENDDKLKAQWIAPGQHFKVCGGHRPHPRFSGGIIRRWPSFRSAVWLM